MANGKLRIKGVTTGGNGGGGATDFISVWDTTLGDGQPTITLPLVASGNYNFSVNWGDGNTDTITAWDQAEVTHTYVTGGVYTVTITGTIEGWKFDYSGDCEKLTQITSLGQFKTGNQTYVFGGCSNLTTVNGILDLTDVTDIEGLFSDCTSLTSIPNINSWNTSGITNMAWVFGNTLFNQPLNNWDVSSVTTMNSMFYGATSFNQDISLWNVSSVTTMNNMFGGSTSFNQPLNSWDVSSVTNMEQMFINATSFNQPLNLWDVSSVIYMGEMFVNSLFNQDISSWDISNVISMPDFITLIPYSYYDNLLNAWSLLTLQNGVALGMSGNQYSAAGATARQSIIDTYGWYINDGGEAA